MANVLSQLLEELNSGHLKVVDLTTPLGPDTPVIDLPPIFAPSPGLTLTEISHYDSRGPAWYWNVLNMGEHTGTHPVGSWLLVRTGWSKRTGREAFLNTQADGSHSPGFHPTCSAFLAKERDILGVGVETVGTDAGQAGGFDPPFPSHTFMHGAGKFGITSLMNLELLPPTGAIVIAAPLKIVNGSGSPLRVIAITP